MPDDGSTQGSTEYTSKFRFEVKWDATVMTALEVSGLEVETQPIEYRQGNSPVFSTIKVPGLQKYGNVTMKKCICPNETFWEWFNQVTMNTIARKTVTITLIDESGAPSMVWTLSNAWIVKVSSTNPISDGNAVAIESIEIAHEGITTTNG
ncbi:MAG: phage tail protein [Roseiflexaceae bacterium]